MTKNMRPQLRTELAEADLAAICAAVAAGSTYAAAAMAAGVRPSALRLRKRADPAVARRLRAAWLEQGRRLRNCGRGALRDAPCGQRPTT